MGDMGEFFKEAREASKARRASNRDAGALALRTAGIPFTEHNGGAHLIVQGGIDYFPGTGRWSDRSTPDGGRGVRGLIRYLGRA